MFKTLLISSCCALAACGGGDGASAAPAAASGASSAVNLSALTCDEVLKLAGNNRSSAYSLAQTYLSQGAKQLDDDSDGTACEKFK
jgi:hypothetical protein